MIVAMKKIFVIVQKKDAAEALGRLRDLGLVHVEHQKLPEGQNIARLTEEIAKIAEVLEYLHTLPVRDQENLQDVQGCAASTITMLETLLQIKEEIAKRQALIQQWNAWGDFEPSDIGYLQGKGFYVKLYKIPEAALPQVPPECACAVIFTQDKIAHCVVVSRQDVALPFPEVMLPAMGLKEMVGRHALDETRACELEAEFRKRCAFIHVLEQYRQTQISDLRLQEALAGMGGQEDLVYVKGFCPRESLARLQAAASQQRWGLVAEDPSAEDQVPTLLRNPRWVELIKPVFGFMNILPGYRELDCSLFFLIFFSIFTGILIGDAAYGVIFLICTGIAHLRLGTKVQEHTIFYLFYGLSFSIIMWGVLSGTYFGQQWLPSSASPLVPWLRVKENMMLLSFVIGVIHLTIAHFWRFLLKIPSLQALSELGILILVWYVFFLIRFLILNIPFPSISPYLLGAAIGLIVLFTTFHKNIFKMIFGSLGELYGSFMSSFGDIISYIRLFAVGLASVAIADAFNSIAINIGFDSFFQIIGASLVLFLGHSLNLILCVMGVLVHGVRLNLLEFSGHLGIEWKGSPFTPLAKTKA